MTAKSSFPQSTVKWLVGCLVLVALLQLAYPYLSRWVAARNPPKPPVQWLGQTWPPPGTHHLPVKVAKGNWVVLFYNSSCGHCQATAGQYADLAAQWQSQGAKMQVALIDVTPDSGMDAPTPRPGLLESSLDHPEFHIGPPVALVLSDGKVKSVHEGWDLIDWQAPEIKKLF